VHLITREVETEDVEGANWSYCSCCGCWTMGDKMHTMEGHKTKQEIQASNTSACHHAATGHNEKVENGRL
jgi:hypothetical protein